MIYLTYTEISREPIAILEKEARECFADNGYVDVIMKKKNTDSVRESLCALVLLYKTLEYAGEDSGMLVLDKDENGRPHLEKRAELDFSISHTDAYVACALSVGDGRVGVDIEKDDENRRYTALANRMFSDEEIREFEDNGESSSAFTRIWTRKEAYFKYLGDASSLPETDKADVSFEEHKIGEFYLTLCRNSCGDMTCFEKLQ